MISIKAAEHVPHDQVGQGVYTIFFTVPKRNGDWSSVLDLRFVNKFIWHHHFHMEALQSVADALQPQEFLTSLDLTDPYLHISIIQCHRKYLRFCVGNLHLQFRALPFGLSIAPRVFTKVLVNPIAFLREQGIHVHPYLDDLLIRSAPLAQAKADTETAITFLWEHGFLLNLAKNELMPRRRIQHLGMVIDTLQSALFLTPDQVKSSSILSCRQDPLMADDTYKATGPSGGEHGSGLVGPVTLKSTTVVPEAIPGSDYSQVQYSDTGSSQGPEQWWTVPTNLNKGSSTM